MDRLQDLVNLERLQQIVDAHYLAAGMPLCLLDAHDQRILVNTAWQEACIDFHRAHPGSHDACLQSDAMVCQMPQDGRPWQYRCLNGLWHIGMPIYAERRHLATLFLSQFFFADETLDRERFLRQAEQYGYDPQAYLAALARVPVFSRAAVGNVLRFNQALAIFLGDLASRTLALRREIAERQHTEQALRASDTRWRYALEGAGDGVWDWNPQDNTIYFSHQWKAMLGYADEELPNRFEEWDRRVHPDDREHAYRQINGYIDGQTPNYICEHRLQCKDGSYKWILDRGLIMERSPEGKPLRMIGTHADITERKLAEQALAESEQRFRALAEASFEGLTFSRNGILLEVNEQFSALMGYTREELIGQPISMLVAPESQERVRQALDSEQSGPYEHLARRKDGSEFHAEVRARTIGKGNQRLRISALHDITERKQAEKQLRLAQFALGRSADIVYWTLPDGRIVYANDAACQSLGYSRDELLRMSVFDIDPQITAEARKFIWDRLGKNGFVTIEALHQRKDGSTFPVEIRSNYLEFEGQQYNCTIIRDRTERQRIEQERLEMQRRLLHAQRLESLGVLAGGIAHDFNNLLMALSGHLDLALLTLAPDSNAHISITKAIQAANRAANLTRQMLAYSGKGKFELQQLQLNLLVEENVHLLQASIPKNIGVELRLSAELLPIEADPGQVQQVVMNLITNAAEAIGSVQGSIAVSTGVQSCDDRALAASLTEKKPAAGRFVFLEVADTGCGMDETTLQRLFDPFFTTKFTGRGLGMSAVLGILQGHRGAIFIHSRPGSGTCVRALFPVSQLETFAQLGYQALAFSTETMRFYSPKSKLTI